MSEESHRPFFAMLFDGGFYPVWLNGELEEWLCPLCSEVVTEDHSKTCQFKPVRNPP